MAGFAVRSRTLACDHGMWEAEQQTDTSSAIVAQAFLIGATLSSGLQTPFPALWRQSLS